MKAHRKKEKTTVQGNAPKELVLKLRKVAEVEGRSVSGQLVKILKDRYNK